MEGGTRSRDTASRASRDHRTLDMIVTTDNELYARGAATLVASWEEYARGSAGAALKRLNGVSTAVFPSEPERGVYNNALLDRNLGPIERATAADAMEEAYESAEVDRYAAWVHESDEGMRAELSSRGYTIAESTRAMGMSLDGISLPLPEIELGPPDWSQHLQYLRVVGVPDGLLAGVDPSGFHALTGLLEGEIVATAIAYDHDRDVGIYNMGTLPHARRRGLGTALTARHLLDAVERGCSTATLQSSPMAERVYAAVGFRNLGRFLEYVPGGAPVGEVADRALGVALQASAACMESGGSGRDTA
jgi:ribosomal protein S18 acetylase RimI-like enzyme